MEGRPADILKHLNHHHALERHAKLMEGGRNGPIGLTVKPLSLHPAALVKGPEVGDAMHLSLRMEVFIVKVHDRVRQCAISKITKIHPSINSLVMFEAFSNYVTKIPFVMLSNMVPAYVLF